MRFPMVTLCSNCGQTAITPTAGGSLCAVCAGEGASPGPHTSAAGTATPGEWEVRHRNQRHFGVCLLLGLLTLGVYFIYWHFTVFGEIARREGRGYAWGLLVADLGLSVVTTVYFLAKYRASGSHAVLISDPVIVVGVMAGAILWAAFLVIETRRLNQSLVSIGVGPTVPVFAAPTVAVGSTALGLINDSPLLDIVRLTALVLVFYLLHSGINQFWQHSHALPGDGRPAPASGAPAAP